MSSILDIDYGGTLKNQVVRAHGVVSAHPVDGLLMMPMHALHLNFHLFAAHDFGLDWQTSLVD